MPEDGMWRTFFDPEAILNAMVLTAGAGDAVDFGCGYGTFIIPAAQRIRGILHGFDIDPEMIAECRRRVEEQNIRNVRLYERDFITDGTGLPEASVDYVMMFNILHTEDPLRLLREAYRILTPGGHAAVIHWNHDVTTPRGPPMAIRPRPADCRRWLTDAGFIIENGQIDLPPYHYGILARKENK